MGLFKVFNAEGHLEGEFGSKAGAKRVYDAMLARDERPLGIVESGTPVPVPLDSGELDSFVAMGEDAASAVLAFATANAS